MDEVTRLLHRVADGDAQAEGELYELLYQRLHGQAVAYMRRQGTSHTLQATALVHETYLRLVRQRGADWKSRGHFLAVAAKAMRHVLVDHARGRQRERRRPPPHRVPTEGVPDEPLDDCDEIIDLEEALKDLAKRDPEAARVIELRFFGGLTVSETAAVMGIAKRRVERRWTFARAWLKNELGR